MLTVPGVVALLEFPSVVRRPHGVVMALIRSLWRCTRRENRLRLLERALALGGGREPATRSDQAPALRGSLPLADDVDHALLHFLGELRIDRKRERIASGDFALGELAFLVAEIAERVH